MTHFGHFNAIRQAKKLCDTLILLINSDKSVLKEKGPVVQTEEERKKILQSCKFVDEVYIHDAYLLGVDVLKTYNADFVMHGDDIVKLPDGTDLYEPFRKLNAFKLV